MGIRRLAGRRLELYTDLPPSDEVDVLPALFDQAFPQWCEYFRIDARQYDSWQMTGFLMAEKDRFQQAGLLPDELPPFEHGYSRNYELWLYEQASAYYRRHLLLHEGTHGLMNTIFGGCGPPWYMEGIAELLATHRWSDGRLVLNHVPQSRDETPMWGRIGFIQKEFAAGHAVPLEVVIGYGSQAHRQPGPYAWCWALALLLDRHPAYRDHFRRLPAMVTRPDFSERFRQALASAWPELGYQWQILVANLDYGHDVARTVVDFTPGRDLPPGGAQVVVQADRGWQNSGFRLPEGARYQLEAAGRYQIDSQPRIWWCEPNGVSIRYHQGRPLGLLLAAVQPDPPFPGPTPLLNPIPVGLGTTIVPRQSGTLFLRINDSPGDLANNRGTLTVRITAPQ